MIQTIEIKIHSGINEELNALIIYEQNIVYLNNKKYMVKKSFIDQIIHTIYLWKEEYGFDNKIDSEEFDIIVKSDDGTKKCHGKGFYPHNYIELKKLLGGLHD